MKSTFKTLLSIFALFSLIACGGNKSSESEVSSSSKPIETTNNQLSSSVEESSSSYEINSAISSNDADEDWQNGEIISFIESSSIEQSSESEEGSSSSEEVITSSEQEDSSSIEGTYYHVTFVNYDDSVLYEVDVLEGESATYRGKAPTKPDDNVYGYEFQGWDIDLSAINSDVTAKAQYKSVPWSPIHWFD